MPRIARLTAPKTIELDNREPLSPGEGEAVIAVETAGICGTDLSLFSGDYPVPLPLVCGHEFVGKVTSTGPGVDSTWAGRRVTAEINNTCVAYKRQTLCSACLTGLSNHCLQRTVTGIIRHDGAFAEEVLVAGGTLHSIPDTLDTLTATLTEPLAAALQTFEMTPASGSETVVVIGPGRLGILIVFAAALKGLTVYAVSRSAKKQERAKRYGAQEVFSPENAYAEVKEKTKGLGADIVVDATGNTDGMIMATALVRPRGTIAVKTTCGLPAQGLDLTKLVVDEIRLQGSRCGPFAPALNILNKHQDTLKHLITSVRPLKEIQPAIQSAFTEEKVILKTG